jgi:hypothetical protein
MLKTLGAPSSYVPRGQEIKLGLARARFRTRREFEQISIPTETPPPLGSHVRLARAHLGREGQDLWQSLPKATGGHPHSMHVPTQHRVAGVQ